jgi:F0F1-type ATP synthase membrane subunit b/b'
MAKTKAPEHTEEIPENGTAPRKPSDQALQAVDVAVGAVPTVADNVRKTVDQWRHSNTRAQEIETLQARVSNLRDANTRPAQVETLKRQFEAELQKAEKRGGDVRKQVTDQMAEQARKARERVEPARKRVEPVVRERVEPIRKRFEPVVRERVEPVYRERVEPTVKKVRERI